MCMCTCVCMYAYTYGVHTGTYIDMYGYIGDASDSYIFIIYTAHVYNST